MLLATGLPLIFGVTLVAGLKKQKWCLRTICVGSLLMLLIVTACSTSNNNNVTSPPPPMSYTVTVTAASAGVQQTAQVAMTMQ